jgi:hypothetical protein
MRFFIASAALPLAEPSVAMLRLTPADLKFLGIAVDSSIRANCPSDNPPAVEPPEGRIRQYVKVRLREQSLGFVYQRLIDAHLGPVLWGLSGGFASVTRRREQRKCRHRDNHFHVVALLFASVY